jgi:hypothetical protein
LGIPLNDITESISFASSFPYVNLYKTPLLKPSPAERLTSVIDDIKGTSIDSATDVSIFSPSSDSSLFIYVDVTVLIYDYYEDNNDPLLSELLLKRAYILLSIAYISLNIALCASFYIYEAMLPINLQLLKILVSIFIFIA